MRWHIPGYIDIEPDPPISVGTVEELMAAPQAVRWMMQPNFERWTQATLDGDQLLIAEFADHHWYVVAYLAGDNFAFPEWHRPER